MLQRTWTVIGAGPCGIAAVGRLIDLDLKVLWIDPKFNCGRMAQYKNVPANTTNIALVEALRMCESFNFNSFHKSCVKQNRPNLVDREPNECSDLSLFVEAIEHATKQLLTKVQIIEGYATKFSKLNKSSQWIITVEEPYDFHNGVNEVVYQTDAIIYACGGEPTVLNSDSFVPFDIKNNNSSSRSDYNNNNNNNNNNSNDGNNIQCIDDSKINLHSLDLMVDSLYVKKLLQLLEKQSEQQNHQEEEEKQKKHKDLSNKVFGVFGRSHSGMLIMKNLIDAGCQKIINFYKSDELLYMTVTENGLLKFFLEFLLLLC
jgi:hypothetical protein